MKQTLASIAILTVIFVCSIADFDLGTFPDDPEPLDSWDESQFDTDLDYNAHFGTIHDIRILDYHPDKYDSSALIDAGCVMVTVPQRYVDEPTDTNCMLATKFLLDAMNWSNTNCALIMNMGWAPVAKNPMTRQHVLRLLALGAPY